jgi:repressor LexA
MARPMELKALAVILSGKEIPNLVEFARELRLSAKSRVSGVLANLEKEGYIECERTATGRIKTRSIRLAKLQRPRPVPVLGRVAAGVPILANAEDITEFIPLPERHVRGEEVFMLEVKGDSMTGDGVLNGDYVIVVSDKAPPDGKIAVVLVGEEATVKRIYHEGESIRLKSSAEGFPDQVYVESDSPAIQGRVIGVVRWLED